MRFLFALIHIFCLSICFSQKDDLSSAIYLEVGGSGGLGSINYEKVFSNREKIDFLWRVGLSIAPIDNNNGTGIVIPAMIHGTIGQKNHKLDMGLGQGITVSTRGSFFLLTTASLGYRYHFKESPLFLRIAYTPLISYLLDFQVQHWAGITIGFTLNTRKK